MSTVTQEQPIAVTATPGPAPNRAVVAVSAHVAALASAAILLLCYFPYDFGGLAWIALVPLLALVRTRVGGCWVFLASWSAGLVFFFPVLAWMKEADDRMVYTWAALALYCSFYFPVAILLVRRLDHRTGLPLVVTFPVVWVALEFLRSFLLTGFAWYYLAHTQHDFLALIQVSDLGGAYLVSFLVAAVNALAFEILYRRPQFRSLLGLKEREGEIGIRPLVIQAAAVALLLAATIGYGLARLHQEEFAAGPVVALLQSNLDQRIRNDGSQNSARTIIDHNQALADWAAAQSPKPELLVWPETSYPGDWTVREPGVADADVARSFQEDLDMTLQLTRDAASLWKTNILLGMNSQVLRPGGKMVRYNSAILILPTAEVVDRYNKMHRVPFGEYVPFRDTIPWMNQFAPYDFDYSILPGERFVRFPLGNRRFGVIICYEDSDPILARHYARPEADGPPVDFLVNISNDGWFDGTAEHEQHLAICRFRAVECRRSVTRAVNMGVSAIIDGSGRVRRPAVTAEMDAGGKFHLINQENAPDTVPVHEWRDFKKTARVLIAAVPIDSRTSLYALWGDWFAAACLAVAGVALLGSFRSQRTAPAANA